MEAHPRGCGTPPSVLSLICGAAGHRQSADTAHLLCGQFLACNDLWALKGR